MRIAVIVGGFPKLSETFILHQIIGLIELGHEVDIYARRRLAESARHPEVDAYRLLDRLYSFDLPLDRFRRTHKAVAALLTSFARSPRLLLRCVNPVRDRSLYAILNNLMHVPPFLKKAYDVYFCHFGGNGIDFAFLKDLFPQRRFITMFHGDDLSLHQEHGPHIFDHLRRTGDLFLVNTDCYGGTILRGLGFDPAKVVTYHYGLPVQKIPFRPRRPGAVVKLLSVARLVPKKGLEHGIRAVALLQNANPALRIEYRIVGDGELRAQLIRLIADVSMSEQIELLGPQPGDAVFRHMDSADLFMLPSLMEQAGMVLLEAQASGMPVVATRVGGVPEMVREGESAVLVPAADPAALAAGVQSLLDHPERWEAMGRAGRRHVEQHHDLQRQAVRLAELLQG